MSTFWRATGLPYLRYLQAYHKLRIQATSVVGNNVFIRNISNGGNNSNLSSSASPPALQSSKCKIKRGLYSEDHKFLVPSSNQDGKNNIKEAEANVLPPYVANRLFSQSSTRDLKYKLQRKPLGFEKHRGNNRNKSVITSTPTGAMPASLLTPGDIYNGLEEFVIGQERVKKVLSVSMYNHFQRLEYHRLQEKQWVEQRAQDRSYAEQIYMEMQRITEEELSKMKLSDYKYLYSTEKKKNNDNLNSVKKHVDGAYGFQNDSNNDGKWVLEEEKYMDKNRIRDLKRRFEAHTRLGLKFSEWNEEREKWLHDYINGADHRKRREVVQQQHKLNNKIHGTMNNSNNVVYQPQQDKYEEMMRRPSLILSEEKAKEEARKSFFELDKPNVLVCGPTGTGKTLMAKTLAKMANVPLVIADATSLTQAGYVGEDVESILYKLLQAADHDVAKAEQGIVYIDEIDKIGKRGRSANLSRDVSGEGVQQALLKMLEGSIVNVPLKRRQPNAEVVQIDTRNILFICGGAFSGISDIIAKRTVDRGIGFNATVAANPYNENNRNNNNNKDTKKNAENITKETNELLDQLEPSDLSSFGLIPEFVGRFPLVISTKALTEDQFVRILCEPKNALVKQYKELFSLQNVEFHATDEALRECAQIAMTKRTGARGLRSIMENCLVDAMFTIPSMSRVNAVYLDADAIKGEGDVKILSKELTLEKYLNENSNNKKDAVGAAVNNDNDDEVDDLLEASGV